MSGSGLSLIDPLTKGSGFLFRHMLQDAASLILCGVVISVSKKLAKDQSELNDLVSSLGGDYRWSYDNSCTHFIFQVNTVQVQQARGQLFEINEILV